MKKNIISLLVIMGIILSLAGVAFIATIFYPPEIDEAEPSETKYGEADPFDLGLPAVPLDEDETEPFETKYGEFITAGMAEYWVADEIGYIDVDHCPKKALFNFKHEDVEKALTCEDLQKLLFEPPKPPQCITLLDYVPEQGVILKNYNWESPPTPTLNFINEISTYAIQKQAEFDFTNNPIGQQLIQQEQLRLQELNNAQLNE